MPGPLPKRIEERRRRNAVPGETVVVMDGAVRAPDLPARGLNPIARAWYESLKDSGQSQFFEPSDWAVAVAAAKILSNALRPSAPASMVNAAWAMIDSLLSTESSRRKAKVQVQRAGQEEPTGGRPVSIEERRRAIGG